MPVTVIARAPQPKVFSFVVVGLIAACLLLPAMAHAADFRVSPSIIELDRGSKTGVVSVVNDGAEPLQLQVKLFEWSEDADGADKYTESSDLVYFPRIMTVDAGSERVLRIGIKAPAVTKERTYRVFVQEIPAPRKLDDKNAALVAVALRFGVPVFIKPVKEEISGGIPKIEVVAGKLNVTVANTGNAHFTIKSINVKAAGAGGEAVFTRDLNGWYLLSGAKRVYTTDLAEQCGKISKINVEVKTSNPNLAGSLDVTKEMCQP